MVVYNVPGFFEGTPADVNRRPFTRFSRPWQLCAGFFIINFRQASQEPAMHSRSFRIVLNLAVIVSMLLPSIALPAQAAAPAPQPNRPDLPYSGLFRAEIPVSAPSDWDRLEKLDVLILVREEDSALVLVDAAQLETLARMGLPAGRAGLLLRRRNDGSGGEITKKKEK